MRSARAIENIHELKQQGHELLEEYKKIAKVGSREAYEDLKYRMGSKDGRRRPWHFGSMNDVQTIKLAIGNIKKMTASKIYENSKISV